MDQRQERESKSPSPRFMQCSSIADWYELEDVKVEDAMANLVEREKQVVEKEKLLVSKEWKRLENERERLERCRLQNTIHEETLLQLLKRVRCACIA